MTSIPVSAADRDCLLAEIESLASALARNYEWLPDPIKARAIELGHSLGSVRRKLQKPQTEQNKKVDNEGAGEYKEPAPEDGPRKETKR